jgi:hypothetical protein
MNVSPNDSNLPQEEGEFYVHLNEYLKLKDEQIKRIGFRDMNIVLVAFGSVISYALGNELIRSYALLALPIVCIVLGWTYVVNDEKISAIGKYVRTDLADKLEKLLGTEEKSLLRWETAHRTDKYKVLRKGVQLVVDEIVFCVSGLVALYIFWHVGPEEWVWEIQSLWLIELQLLLHLSILIGIQDFPAIKK